MPDEEVELIFRRTIRLKDGRVLIAAHYGLKAFPIRIRKEKPKKPPKRI